MELIRRISSGSVAILMVLSIAISSLIIPGAALAISGADFQAGHIIDDFVFENSSSMSVQDIQNFLNAKVPTCDTNGTLSYSYFYDAGTGRVSSSSSDGHDTWVTTSRAVFGQRYDSFYSTNIAAGPLVCLKSYVENTTTNQNNLHGASVTGGISAAQIIWNAAQTYRINPQVLIVTLQKEQGLVTDDWPWANQFQEAMGYNCPDTPQGCNSADAGFFTQVTDAAWQFRHYLENNGDPGNYWIGNYFIPYNPSASCGGTVVNIQNGATAALYDYTPYQPNPGALAGVSNTSSGGSASCGAYGNRNFWWYFTQWFGSPYSNCSLLDMTGKVYRLYNPQLKDTFYTTDSMEACTAQSRYGYAGDGFTFTETDQSSGGSPIYRLTSPSNQHFYTASATERDVAVNQLGYTNEGVGFYTLTSPAAGYTPVYRLISRSTGAHYFTPSAAEKDNMINKLGYSDEGIAFYTQANTSANMPIYRLRTPAGAHFYTASAAEKNYAVANLGFADEGVAFYGQSSYNNQTIPVYRLLAWPQHMFTASLGERGLLLQHGFTNESIGFYAPTTSVSGAVPIYRLYRSSDGDHLFTASAFERDQAVKNAGYTYEGVAFGGFSS